MDIIYTPNPLIGGYAIDALTSIIIRAHYVHPQYNKPISWLVATLRKKREKDSQVLINIFTGSKFNFLERWSSGLRHEVAP